MWHKRYRNVKFFEWSSFCVNAVGKDNQGVYVYMSLGDAGHTHLYLKIKKEQRVAMQRVIDDCWDDIIHARGNGVCAVIRGLPAPR